MSDVSSEYSDTEWISEYSVQCLICLDEREDYDSIVDHMLKVHNFDFGEITINKTYYEKIKTINYIRQTKDIEVPNSLDDKYLIPVLQNDAFIYLLNDSEQDDSEENQSCLTNINGDNLLSNEVRELKIQLSKYQDLVHNLTKDDVISVKNEEPKLSQVKLDYYFDSYSQIDIHEQMLKDKVRTNAYRDFIYDNKDLFQGKVVLDVGCGTGILSMFASKAGAIKVYAVDNSEIIEMAKTNASENNLTNIVFLRGKMEELFIEPVDIIISEWMGYFLLYESMFDSVIHARTHFLKPNGFLLPSRSTINLSMLHDDEWINDRLHYWNDVYGFKMTSMKKFLFGDAIVDCIGKDVFGSNAAVIFDMDSLTINVSDLDFSTNFEITASSDFKLYALFAYFDNYFSHPTLPSATNILTTSPSCAQTHWKQTVFMLKDGPFEMKHGMVMKGSIHVSKSEKNERELDVVLKYELLDLDGSVVGEQKYLQAYRVR